mgnify:CR=1 FL=1
MQRLLSNYNEYKKNTRTAPDRLSGQWKNNSGKPYSISNQKGIRFAVIVNDIGEVNIDADLIQKGGVVGKKDESLVSLQNGCICCTLKADLIEQILELMKQQRFDYIVIEASGICEPEPIANTICSIPRLGGPTPNTHLPSRQHRNCRGCLTPAG